MIIYNFLLIGLFMASWYARETAAGLADVVRANGNFALNLYSQLSPSSDGGNIFFSPLSISSALAMTYVGARGQTKSQMEATLGLQALAAQSSNSVHASFKELMDALADPTANYTLKVANRLFGRLGYQFLQDFLDTQETYYGAPLEELDFVKSPEPSREHINQWVEEQTNDKIKGLIPQGSITGETALVLVNAIYFKGLWQMPFSPDRTTSQPFYTSASQSVMTDMMSLGERHFSYYEHTEWDADIVELPYEGNRASMVLVLPKQREGLKSVEDVIDIASLDAALANLRSAEVIVSLPRFRLTQTVTLKAFLSSMGMTDIFDSNLADLSGMNGGRDLFVTEAIHKSYVDVNEEGTEAAGATGVIVALTSLGPPPKVFTADHPFIFFIRDTQTGTILFMGRLFQPEEYGVALGRFGIGPEDLNGQPRFLASFTLLIACLSLLMF